MDRIPELLGEIGDDEDNRTVVYFREPLRSGYVLIPRAPPANVTSLEHERWKRAQLRSGARSIE